MRAITLILLIFSFVSNGYGETGEMGGSEVAVKNSLLEQPLSVPLVVPLETFAKAAVSGGLGRDDIPSIDDPRFISPQEADRYLKPDDVVFGVALNGEAKAYPQRILV